MAELKGCASCNPIANHGYPVDWECPDCGERLPSRFERQHKILKHDADLETCACLGCYKEPMDNGHCASCKHNRN